MQRHLALLSFLFPLPKRRVKENRDVSAYLNRAKQQMTELHERTKERAIQAITLKNNLQNQVEDIEKILVSLDEKVTFAEARGDQELADKLRRERQGFEQCLATAKETFQQAVETAEQVKIAIKREEEAFFQQAAQVQAFEMKWGQADLQLEMEKELRRIGIWHLAVPPQPNIDRKTARELVGFLFLLIAGLLLWQRLA